MTPPLPPRQLEHLSPVLLKPHPKNPREHSARQIRQIARSMKTFGFQGVVLIDSQDRLICGHARVEAAKQLGLAEIPVLRVIDLTDAQIRTLMVADNRLTEISTWNKTLLGENFKILSDLDLDFELDVTGFDYGDIEHMIESSNQEGNADSEEEPPPDPLTIEPVTQPGDLWVLRSPNGIEHRLLCGSATENETYSRLLDRSKAAMIFTDPPYNLAASDIGQVCAASHGNFAMAAGEMTREEFTNFLSQVMDHLCQHSTNGSIHYLFMDWRHAPEILTAGIRHYSAFKNLCIWVKDRPGMGTFYRSQHELIFVFKHGKAPHQNHFELGQHGRTRSNVWPYPSVRSLQAGNGDPSSTTALAMHPTIKPVKLIEDAIRDCSKRKQIVLDPFLGSGSTLIACEQTQRRCFGIELEPRYVDVAITRWHERTGVQAIHQPSGQTFEDLNHHRKKESSHG